MKHPIRLHPLRATLLLLLAVTLPSSALAHARGEDYVFFSFRADSIDGYFEIRFDDLDEKWNIAIDGGADEATVLAQVDATAAQVIARIREGFAIGPEGGAPYDLEFTHQAVTILPRGGFAQYHFTSATGPLPDSLAVRHAMLRDGDRMHRGLLLVEYNARTDTTYPGEYTAMVFGPSNPEQVLDLTDIPSLLGPREMIWQGVLHIWIGIDHILFLVALLLPTVLRRRDGSWQPVDSFGAALWNVLKIVTVFTVAHSITLALAAFDFITLPSRLVESVIALSIVVVAAANLLEGDKESRHGSLLVILGLGLFHGLGFASVMGHLPLRMVDLLRGVVGFNVGVELGQIAIVAAMFPLLFLLRRWSSYVPLVLKGGSLVLIAIAGWWFVERALGLG